MKRPRKNEKTPNQEGAENPNPKPRKRAQKSTTESAPEVQRPSEEGKGIFSNEILTNILSRLPAKSLIRFTSVSKWWYDLVSSPELPALHLQASLQTSSNDLALVFQENSAYYSVEMDKVEKLDMTVSAQVDKSLAGGSWIVASCNGLVCLRAEKDNVILFNLATQTRYDLPILLGDHPDRYPPSPDPEFGYQTHTKVRFGFGYDSTCHDYKLWRICVFSTDINNSSFAIIAKVYSLKGNKWTRVKDFPEKIIGDIESDSGVLYNETLHWVASVKNENLFYRTGIVGFELHGEKYRQLPVPNNHGFDFPKMSSLGVLDGCLCVTYTPSQLQSKDVAISVWVMKEYGNQESWSKLFNIGRDEIKPINSARALAYSKSRDKVLIDLSYSGLIWYDLRNAKIEECVGWKSYYPGREVCMRTLVSPKTGSFCKKGEKLACGPFVWKSDDYNPYDYNDPYSVPDEKRYYDDSDSDGYPW